MSSSCYCCTGKLNPSVILQTCTTRPQELYNTCRKFQRCSKLHRVIPFLSRLTHSFPPDFPGPIPGITTNTVTLLYFRPHRQHCRYSARCGLLLQLAHVAWSVCLSVCLSVCMLVMIVSPENGYTDRDAVWGADPRGPNCNRVLDGVDNGATWRIRSDAPCSATMRAVATVTSATCSDLAMLFLQNLISVNYNTNIGYCFS